MEVRKGYKETEIGLLPENWEVKKLGELVSLRTGPFGSSVHKSDYINGGIPFINPIHIFNGELFPDPDVTVSPETVSRLSEFQLRTNDIIMGRRGEMGRCAVVQENQQGWLCGSGSMILRPNSKINPEFLQRVISSPLVIGKIEETSVGSTMINLNQTVVNGLPITYPPLAEQEAIAEALSDADALIESLETLLAKKRQVKQGAIQELLTGRKRLLGFEKKHGYKETEVGTIPADWTSVSIAELCGDKDGSIKIGPFGSQLKREYLVSSGYKVYGQENVYAQDINIGDRYLTKEHFLKLKSCELLSGDFIVSMMGTIGQCMIVPNNIEQGIIDSHLIRIRPNPKVIVPEYMSYYYSSKLVFDQISRLQVGGIMAGLSSSVIKQIYIGLPNSIEEQTAIAEILSDMDAEIRALEEKLFKARGVKAGMMSELLTGRVRLPP
jgi:type I restriction enzyme S subunit